MARKGESFGAALQRQVDKMNKRSMENMALYRSIQARTGKKSDEPINLMDLIK